MQHRRVSHPWAASGLTVAVIAALSACSAPPPPPSPPPPPPVAHSAPRPAPLDWFQRQLVAARAARRDHRPASDKAGAQQAYDGIVRAACERVALSGPDKYKPRCNALLQAAAAPQDPFRCDAAAEDPDTLQACND